MNAYYVYPGSFIPPTYGHYDVVKKIARNIPSLTIVCSTNPKKKARWFTEQECCQLWSGYRLPKNVDVVTLEAFIARQIPRDQLVMVRGIRGESDLGDEMQVMLFNKENFGIDKYLHVFSDCQLQNVSSTLARQKATDLDLQGLGKLVSPLVVTRLLEKVLNLENIFLAVGKPGAGKSTFLNLLTERHDDCAHINTDLFNRQLKPLLESAFPGRDILEVFRNNLDELKRVITPPWMDLLAEAMKLARQSGKKHLFVEAAYALSPEHELFRYVGGKVLYLDGQRKHRQRVLGRGTPEHLDFIRLIPGLADSKKIADRKKLKLESVSTDGSLDELKEKIDRFHSSLNERRLPCFSLTDGLNYAVSSE